MIYAGRIGLLAMAAIALGLMLNGPASATGVTGFRLGGRPAQDVFTNPQTASLAKAACTGSVSKINALVKNGADVNGRGEKGITPLIWAMTCYNYKGMEALLQHGANPNQPMAYGQAPTWLAAGGSDLKILPILLGHGGNPNYYCADCQGTSALENAIDYQRTANMKLLVQHGANVNFIGALSPGECAVAAGRFDYIIYLLHHGYDHDLQGMANAILQKKATFNPHWSGYSMWKWQYKYWKEALQMLAAKGYKAHKIPWTIAPMNPPSTPAAGSQ